MKGSIELAPHGSSMPDAGREPISWRDIGPVVLTCVGWTLLAFLIDASGDFPLLDDWAYGLPVRALLERGEIRLTDWNCPILIAQACWGALFCLPAGFSFTSLRISTLVAGLIGLLSMYGLMRQIGAQRMVALFATWTVGANPAYVALSYTFMTDIPFISLLILSTFLLVRGIVRDRNEAIWLGLGAALLSVFIRQIGVAIFLGFLVAYPFWRGLGRRWLLEALVPTVVAFGALKACERGLLAFDRLPRAYSKSSDSTVLFLSLMAKGKLGVFKVLPPKIWDVLVFLGMYAAPFSLLCWPSRLARLSRRVRIVEISRVAALTVFVTLAIVLTGGEVLRDYNIVYDFGVGPRLGHSYLRAAWPGKMPLAAGVALKALAGFGMILALEALARVIWRVLIRPRTSAEMASRSYVLFLIATCVFYYGPISLSFSIVYDRYLLAMLPLAVALIWKGICAAGLPAPDAPLELRPIGVVAGLASLALCLAFATAATHDYLDWSRERWMADLYLAEKLAIPASDIDGGWEFNNYNANLERLYKSQAERELVMAPEEKVGDMWGKTLDRPYRISVPLATGYEAIRRVPLSPWLPLAPHEFILSRKTGPSPATP